MRSPFCFLVSPKESRYENSKKIGNFNFITNTSIEDAKDVSRVGIVKEVPIKYEGHINKGDEVIVHHNIFREFYDIEGKRKDSKSYFKDGLYIVYPDSIYLYKKSEWKCNDKYIFVKPINQYNKIKYKKEEAYLLGEIVYPNGNFTKGDIVGFTPESEYEIKVDDQKLYRMRLSDICLSF